MMKIIIVEDKISLNELKKIAEEFYTSMIKGVVDIERGIVAFGGEYHMDANVVLLNNQSEQKNIWGFNLYFNKPKDSWLEYTSLINIRPLADNNDMEVQNNSIREKMKEIINSKIT